MSSSRKPRWDDATPPALTDLVPQLGGGPAAAWSTHPSGRHACQETCIGRADLSTGCTECCGNVDYSTFANCGIFVLRPPCAVSREAIHSLLRRARRGSRTKQHREVVRGGPQGPKRKVDRGCGRNRDRLGEFFGPHRPIAPPSLNSTTIAAMHFRPPSIDQGV